MHHRQLADIAKLYPEATIRKHLLPISLRLCSDQVARVRDAANAKVALLINHLVDSNYNDLLTEYIGQLVALATHVSCVERQTYARICESLTGVIPNQLFCTHFLQPLLNLQTDRIPNVRFVVSRVIAAKLLPNGMYRLL
jgi:hypothetical protein